MDKEGTKLLITNSTDYTDSKGVKAILLLPFAGLWGSLVLYFQYDHYYIPKFVNLIAKWNEQFSSFISLVS